MSTLTQYDEAFRESPDCRAAWERMKAATTIRNRKDRAAAVQAAGVEYRAAQAAWFAARGIAA